MTFLFHEIFVYDGWSESFVIKRHFHTGLPSFGISLDIDNIDMDTGNCTEHRIFTGQVTAPVSISMSLLSRDAMYVLIHLKFKFFVI